jgi:protein gp37
VAKTTITWADAIWNVTTGCSKISSGCLNCYACKMAGRLKAMGQENYRNDFALTLQPGMLERPLEWRTPQRIFVDSMSDLFHSGVPEAYIREVFSVMERANWHTFLVLTKRSERLRELAPTLPWPANIWCGVSVENERYLNRVDDLRVVPAAVRFISAEPLLGPLTSLNLEGINWVIAGGESGSGFRKMEPAWAEEIRLKCEAAGTAFLFKQWAGLRPKTLGRKLAGKEYNEYPVTAGVRCDAA